MSKKGSKNDATNRRAEVKKIIKRNGQDIALEPILYLGKHGKYMAAKIEGKNEFIFENDDEKNEPAHFDAIH